MGNLHVRYSHGSTIHEQSLLISLIIRLEWYFRLRLFLGRMISKNTFLSNSHFLHDWTPNDPKIFPIYPHNSHEFQIFYLLTFRDGVWFFILALLISLVSTSVICLSCKTALFAVFIFCSILFRLKLFFRNTVYMFAPKMFGTVFRFG